MQGVVYPCNECLAILLDRLDLTFLRFLYFITCLLGERKTQAIQSMNKVIFLKSKTGLLIPSAIVVIIMSSCNAMTQYTDWDKVYSDMNNVQQQYAQQPTKKQNTQVSQNQQQTGYVQPRQQTNSNSLTRENDAKQIENEGVSLARQTSDYNKAQAIKLTASSLANKIRKGEINLTQAQAQLRGSQTQQSGQTQQSIQVAGWYYTNQQYGKPKKTTISLTVQKRETGGAYPQYLILSAGGQKQSSVIASYDRNTGLYVFTLGSRTTVYFNM